MNLATAGRERVFIAFGRVEGGSTADRNGPNKLISVVSPQTGEVTSVYRLPADADAFNVPDWAASATSSRGTGETAAFGERTLSAHGGRTGRALSRREDAKAQ